MRHHDEPSSGLLWSIIAASAVVHVTSLLLGQTILSEWRWQQYPVHSSIEMIGALIALEVARQLISLEGHNDGGSYNTQIAAALIGMGILDAAHAMVLAGNCFVWLHSIATFVGGLLFSLIWLPRQWPLWHRHRWPLTVLAGSGSWFFATCKAPERGWRHFATGRGRTPVPDVALGPQSG